MDKGESVEPQLSHPYCQLSINSISSELGHGNARLPTTLESGGGHSASGTMGRGIGPWKGMSIDDLSTINTRYAVPTNLNKVAEESNLTSGPEASGSDFPYMVLLDFAQDMTLGREEAPR